MVRGRGRPPLAARAARGFRLDHATTSGFAASSSPVDVAGAARGRRSATPASPPSPGLVGHSDRTTLEFVMELHDTPRGHLHLPRPFTRAMKATKPRVLWLRAHGCSHGAMQVCVEYPKRHSMLLGRGWKVFARAHGLEDGHILRFKLEEVNMLSVKFYGHTCVRLSCCEEGSSGAECPSSSDSNEGGTSGSGSLGRSGSRGVKLECDSLSSD
ncbi:l-ascorbate oxidase-like protein [Hordeum vulgare]|nr:l-ascorbate oxidase-like protein [Hordeum vulgare]